MGKILITGANKGLGFQAAKELAAKGHEVILTGRRLDALKTAKAQLQVDNTKHTIYLLDMESEESIDQFTSSFCETHDLLDVLINNAGVYLGGSPSTVSRDRIKKSMVTNFFGPWYLAQNMIPLLKKSRDPRIINVSSGAGKLDSLTQSYSAYRLSKLALNGLTQVLANELSNFSINAVSPGWVRTDMGGSAAPRSVKQGADSIIWLATTPNPPSGKFIHDRQVIPW